MPNLNNQLLQADLVSWEASYLDNTFDREREGAKYSNLKRNKLKSFRLVGPDGTVVFEAFPPPGASGRNLIFRRRTLLVNENRNVLFIIAWQPHGPAFAVSVDSGNYRVLDTGLATGDPELFPVQPMPGEPKDLIDIILKIK